MASLGVGKIAVDIQTRKTEIHKYTHQAGSKKNMNPCFKQAAVGVDMLIFLMLFYILRIFRART